jgi:hypothetical protein
VKLIVEFIEIAVKVIRFLPIIVFSYAGLTLVFAVINLVEHNTVTGSPLRICRIWYISCDKDISNKKKMEPEIPNRPKYIAEMNW